MAFQSRLQYELVPNYSYTEPSLTPVNINQFAPYGEHIEMNYLRKSPLSSIRGYSSVPSLDRGEESYPEALPPQPIQRFKTSWRVGARAAAVAALISLLINAGAGIWAVKQFGFGNGLVEVFRGDCTKVDRINLVVHLAINALSTALLSGSNYCMQCLSAPSRDEVDKAHAKRRWLDIGVPSIRNLRSIARGKVFVWWILGLSSVPLHLM
jgi:hypothetical protein